MARSSLDAIHISRFLFTSCVEIRISKIQDNITKVVYELQERPSKDLEKMIEKKKLK
jgi:hypothetical protein